MYIVVGLQLCHVISHSAMLVPTVMVHSCRTLQYMYGCPQIIYSKAMINS